MNLRNNIFVEVMHAHFNHYLQYYRHEPLNRGKNNPSQPPPTHGYPDDFFSIFEMITDPTDEKRKAVNERLEKLLENNADQLPQLDNVAKPQVKYNSILGVRMNLKQIKVGHPDNRVTIVTYRYQFYKLHYVVMFLLSQDKMKRTHIYNNHLRAVQREIYPDILPQRQTKVERSKQVVEKLEVAPLNDAKSPEFTLRRRVIALINMLGALGVDFSRTDLTQTARFIHVILDKEIPTDRAGNVKMDNSPIYKMAKTLNKVSVFRLKTDLLSVKNLFQQFPNLRENAPMQELIKQLEIKAKESAK